MARALGQALGRAQEGDTRREQDHVGSTFQVDLRGIVDLLSHHIYSSPRVYLRELVQNGVDALTARGITPDSLGDTRTGILILPADVAADGRLHTFDSGIGLDADDIRTFLATIGRSSKRDEMGFTRSDLLGQFGIGLLSAFMVTDEIEVLTRKGDAPLVRWRGRSDGSYALEENPADASDAPAEGDERLLWLAEGPGHLRESEAAPRG